MYWIWCNNKGIIFSININRIEIYYWYVIYMIWNCCYSDFLLIIDWLNYILYFVCWDVLNDNNIGLIVCWFFIDCVLTMCWLGWDNTLYFDIVIDVFCNLSIFWFVFVFVSLVCLSCFDCYFSSCLVIFVHKLYLVVQISLMLRKIRCKTVWSQLN